MWDVVKARHPKAAAQLAHSPAVITHEPIVHVPASVPADLQHTSEHAQQARPHLEYVLHHHHAHQVEGSPRASMMGIDASAYSNLNHSSADARVGWELLVPVFPQAPTRQPGASSVARNTRASPTTTDNGIQRVSAHRTSNLQLAALSSRLAHAGLDTALSADHNSTLPATQSEVLRRAQAAFADLRQMLQNAVAAPDAAHSDNQEAAAESHNQHEHPDDLGSPLHQFPRRVCRHAHVMLVLLSRLHASLPKCYHWLHSMQSFVEHLTFP